MAIIQLIIDRYIALIAFFAIAMIIRLIFAILPQARVFRDDRGDI